MKNEHTPGPWKIWRDMDPKEPMSIVGPSSDFTCQIAMENTQAVANAHLIAAAPDLLESLKTLVTLTDRKHDAWDKARAAIAKATGKTP